MDLHFTGTLAEFQALFSAAGSADALAARLTTFTNQLERIQMDLNQATQLLNTANSKLDTANANAQAGIEALVKIRGETAGLVDAVANLTAIVQAGNVTSAEFDAALATLSDKAAALETATGGIVIGTTEIDALVPDAAAPGG
jgi:prefoldin subunit 5